MNKKFCNRMPSGQEEHIWATQLGAKTGARFVAKYQVCICGQRRLHLDKAHYLDSNYFVKYFR